MILSRNLYGNIRHFHEISDLKEAIIIEWEEIEENLLKTLTESSKGRLKATIRAHGDIEK